MSRRSSEPASAALTTLGGLLVCVGLAGCGGLEPVAAYEAITDPAQVYAALTLDARAINLATTAPYHTVQLTATPRNALGEAMPDLPAPTFRLGTPDDSSVLQVTPEGHITALAAGSKIAVVAELIVAGPIRHADTALITVTVTPTPLPVLASLSIEPLAPESPFWPLGSDVMSPFLQVTGLVTRPVLTPRPLDQAGQPISELVVEFSSLNPARATVSRWTGEVTLRRLGLVHMVARTTAYGVTRADTALFTVTWPLEGTVRNLPGSGAGRVFEPDEIRILPNGILYWTTELGSAVDIVFDDPTNVVSPPAPLCNFFQILGDPDFCGAGNMLIPGGPEGSFNGLLRGRQFPVAGIYGYRSTTTGATGRVIVTDELPAEASAP